jgi:broad specificity phosphatase PhoE
VRRLILARHAETELSVRGVLNGDRAVEVRLTSRGVEQARALGGVVGRVDLVAHSSFGRTRETAELAWPDAPRHVVPELDEISYGRFEGTAWADGYGDWCASAAPDEECPGGGESRVVAIARYLRGYRQLLERPEETVAAVAHAMHVAYVLLALHDRPPAPVLGVIPPAVPIVVARERFAEALDVIDAWVREPAWA